MSEYCEYMWNPTRGTSTSELARSIYLETAKLETKDKKLAVRTVRAILRGMPNIDLTKCTDEYIIRFLLARKYRADQTAALIGAYQAQIAHRPDIFDNLTARDPAIQRALRAGIPGVLPARDKKGRCILVILASQWDPIAVPALSVQRAIFFVLETLIQDPRNQQCGFVAVVDWSGFSLRQGSSLGATAIKDLIVALRGRFPARFKAIHFLSAPIYVQATLALVKPFLDEKTRHRIYLHGNNMSTLHEHLPVDILSAELGGTGPAFNPGLWADFVIHSAMEEAELAAIKRDKAKADKSMLNKQDNIENNSIVKNKKYQQDTKNTTIDIPLIDINSESEKPSTVNNENTSKSIDNPPLDLKDQKKNYIDNEKRDDEILDNDQRLKLPENNNDNKDMLTTESAADTDFFNFSSKTSTNDFDNIWGPYEKNNSQDNLINNQTIGIKTPENQNKEHSEEINLMS